MNAKRIYRVTFTDLCPKTGKPRFINFECRAPSVEALTTMLNDGQIVLGQTLFPAGGEHHQGGRDDDRGAPLAVRGDGGRGMSNRTAAVLARLPNRRAILTTGKST